MFDFHRPSRAPVVRDAKAAVAGAAPVIEVLADAGGSASSEEQEVEQVASTSAVLESLHSLTQRRSSRKATQPFIIGACERA